MQVDGHEHAANKERGLHEHGDDGAREELAAREDAELEHRLLQPELAVHEQRHDQDASNGNYQVEGVHTFGADGRATVEQPNQSERGHDDGRLVELRRPVLLAYIGEEEEGEDDGER